MAAVVRAAPQAGEGGGQGFLVVGFVIDCVGWSRLAAGAHFVVFRVVGLGTAVWKPAAVCWLAVAEVRDRKSVV